LRGVSKDGHARASILRGSPKHAMRSIARRAPQDDGSGSVVEPGSLLPARASGTASIALFFAGSKVARTVIAVPTFSRIDGRLIKIQSELVLLKWMVGFDIAIELAILTRLFFH
jgi:hypothetical protein